MTPFGDLIWVLGPPGGLLGPPQGLHRGPKGPLRGLKGRALWPPGADLHGLTMHPICPARAYGAKRGPKRGTHFWTLGWPNRPQMDFTGCHLSTSILPPFYGCDGNGSDGSTWHHMIWHMLWAISPYIQGYIGSLGLL